MEANRREPSDRRGACMGGGPAGFTIVEMMVVVGVIALLAAMLMPYFSRVYEIAYRTRCQRNLRTIADALHASSEAAMTVPEGASWLGAAIGKASRDAVLCDKDPDQSVEDYVRDNLEEFYILQYHTHSLTNYDCSFITDILAGGQGAVPDPQIWAWYPDAGIHDNPKGETWDGALPTNLQDNQAFIGVDNDSCIQITFGSTVTIECMTPPAQAQSGYSRHWVVQGAGTPRNPLPNDADPSDDDDQEILHMWGRDNKAIDPRSPYVISSGRASYGINSLVRTRQWSPDQIMLMDANELVINIDSANLEDVFEEVVQPRHFGKANVVTVGSSVTTWSLADLEEELDKRDEPGLRSLWDPR